MGQPSKIAERLRHLADFVDDHGIGVGDQTDGAMLRAAANSHDLLLRSCKLLLPFAEHAEKCEASADDGYGPELRRLRAVCLAGRSAISGAEE